MKLFRALIFLLLVIVLSWPIFQFFQSNPGYFPVPNFSPETWKFLKSCCGISSYENKQDFQFLMTVLISLFISAFGVWLVFKFEKYLSSRTQN